MNEVTTTEATEVVTKTPTDLFLMFGIDEHRAEGGSPMELGGTTFRVLPLNAPRYRAAYQKMLAEIVAKFGTESVEDSVDDIIAREGYFKKAHKKLLAKHIIVGWDNLVFRGKATTGYDPEVAEALLQMDAFMDTLIEHANNRKNYAATSITEAEAKN